MNKLNEFVKLYAQLDYRSLDVKFPRIKLNELEKKIEMLTQKGYQKLRYGNWDDEEIRGI